MYRVPIGRVAAAVYRAEVQSFSTSTFNVTADVHNEGTHVDRICSVLFNKGDIGIQVATMMLLKREEELEITRMKQVDDSRVTRVSQEEIRMLQREYTNLSYGDTEGLKAMKLEVLIRAIVTQERFDHVFKGTE